MQRARAPCQKELRQAFQETEGHHHASQHGKRCCIAVCKANVLSRKDFLHQLGLLIESLFVLFLRVEHLRCLPSDTYLDCLNVVFHTFNLLAQLGKLLVLQLGPASLLDKNLLRVVFNRLLD